MSFTQTPNYSLYKPTINADNDQWGTHLNANADTLDTTLATFATPASVAAAVAPYANDVGRNLIHNPYFNVVQRGAGPWTTPQYTADRWNAGTISDTISFSIVSGAVIDGEDEVRQSLNNTFTGNAAAGAFNVVYQGIEDVRRLGNRTVTVSFWAWAASGTPKLGASIDQSFGTGGSPSTSVQGVGQSVTLTTAPTRYSLTFTLATTAGKVVGTNSDSATYLQFWYSSGTTNATRAGNIGVQSGTVALTGVQLEVGTQATPLEKPDPQQDLAKCMRFASVISPTNRVLATAAGAVYAHTITYPQAMRAVPTATVMTAGATFNTSAASLTPLDARNGSYAMTATAAGDCYAVNFIYLLSADL